MVTGHVPTRSPTSPELTSGWGTRPAGGAPAVGACHAHDCLSLLGERHHCRCALSSAHHLKRGNVALALSMARRPWEFPPVFPGLFLFSSKENRRGSTGLNRSASLDGDSHRSTQCGR